jgi:DNA-directed RNA polymerase subunit RPC12/RpoP
MFLYQCANCKLKLFKGEKRLPSLWVSAEKQIFCHYCNLQYGISHLKYINENTNYKWWLQDAHR